MLRRPNSLFFDQNMVKVDLTNSHSNTVKYLGVYIDENLSWDCHINELCKKLSISNGIIAKLRHCVPKNTVISVYYSIFYPHLSYGCHVWSLTTKNNIELVNFKKNVLELSISPCLMIILMGYLLRKNF